MTGRGGALVGNAPDPFSSCQCQGLAPPWQCHRGDNLGKANRPGVFVLCAEWEQASGWHICCPLNMVGSVRTVIDFSWLTFQEAGKEINSTPCMPMRTPNTTCQNPAYPPCIQQWGPLTLPGRTQLILPVYSNEDLQQYLAEPSLSSMYTALRGSQTYHDGMLGCRSRGCQIRSNLEQLIITHASSKKGGIELKWPHLHELHIYYFIQTTSLAFQYSSICIYTSWMHADTSRASDISFVTQAHMWTLYLSDNLRCGHWICDTSSHVDTCFVTHEQWHCHTILQSSTLLHCLYGLTDAWHWLVERHENRFVHAVDLECDHCTKLDEGGEV